MKGGLKIGGIPNIGCLIGVFHLLGLIFLLRFWIHYFEKEFDSNKIGYSWLIFFLTYVPIHILAALAHDFFDKSDKT